MYAFDGPHAMYMDYAADNVRARGQITETDVLIADATASAYGAAVTTHESTIGIDAPFPFRFQGRTTASICGACRKPCPCRTSRAC